MAYIRHIFSHPIAQSRRVVASSRQVVNLWISRPRNRGRAGRSTPTPCPDYLCMGGGRRSENFGSGSIMNYSVIISVRVALMAGQPQTVSVSSGSETGRTGPSVVGNTRSGRGESSVRTARAYAGSQSCQRHPRLRGVRTLCGRLPYNSDSPYRPRSQSTTIASIADISVVTRKRFPRAQYPSRGNSG